MAGRWPTSAPSSDFTTRSRSTPAASVFSPGTIARLPAIWASRWSASGCSIARATSISALHWTGGRRTATSNTTSAPHHSWLSTVETFGRPVHVRAWKMMVGRVPIYLLDTNLEANHPEDRGLMNKLYAGGPELRLRQEWILGVGGVRVLRALGIDPGVWHANEGHAAFMMVERIREMTVAGTSYPEALNRVRSQSVFTTHTPVSAGHDAFTNDQLEACAGPVWQEMGVDRETLFGLGTHPT